MCAWAGNKKNAPAHIPAWKKKTNIGGDGGPEDQKSAGILKWPLENLCNRDARDHSASLGGDDACF